MFAMFALAYAYARKPLKTGAHKSEVYMKKELLNGNRYEF